jgi:hypothetical protein
MASVGSRWSARETQEDAMSDIKAIEDMTIRELGELCSSVEERQKAAAEALRAAVIAGDMGRIGAAHEDFKLLRRFLAAVSRELDFRLQLD